MSLEIYAENILEHYKNPKNFGRIKNPDIEAKDVNPVCGDRIEIYVKLDKKGKIKDIKFSGAGCAITQASASMLTERFKGKHIDEIKDMSNEELVKILNISISAGRLKCALLPLKVLKLGYYQYKAKE